MKTLGGGIAVLGFVAYVLASIAGLGLLANGAATAFGDFGEGLRIIGIAVLVGMGGSFAGRLTILAGTALQD